MVLATLKPKNKNNRDGDLVVVSRDHSQAVYGAEAGAPTLLAALQDWKQFKAKLETLSLKLNQGSASKSFRFSFEDCLAPLPNAPGFYDGSAFLSHVVRARRARGDEMPESAKKTPLMYQGVSDHLLPWNAPIELMDPAYGADFEGEFAAIMADVPKGTPASSITPHIALFMLFNDITYRELIKQELPTMFGFLQSKPNSSFAPLAITPDELGVQWDGQRITGSIQVKLNGESFGSPDGKEMHFSMQELIAHACRTRPLSAGSIVGTGTISNSDAKRGFACLTEKRFQEILDQGKPLTPWLKVGDRVSIDYQVEGRSVFGKLEEVVI